MLENIPADEVGRHGGALEVVYQPDPSHPDLLLVDVAVHRTDADSAHIRSSELSMIVIRERMTREAMRTRVAHEATRRGIARVAWIEAAADESC